MHGTFPSQNKQEKEHRKRQIELKRETMPMGDTPLHTVQKSADAMKRSGQAFVELDTKHKLSASDFTAAKQKLAAVRVLFTIALAPYSLSFLVCSDRGRPQCQKSENSLTFQS
jgi:hypothetical protein